MGETLTAQERLRRLTRDKRRVRRERLVRQAAGPLWERLRSVVPRVYLLAGPLEVHRLTADRELVLSALHGKAVLTLDTAMRSHTGFGLLAGSDVHLYLPDRRPLTALQEAGLVSPSPEPDRVLVRPWAGPPRLFAVITPDLPPHEPRPDGTLVVTREHLVREILGAVGLRFDLLAPLLMEASPPA